MAYAEKRKGRLTGVWIGEAQMPPIMGKRSKVRERFETLAAAERWEGLVKLTGALPRGAGEAGKPAGMTVAEGARACLDAGGPRGKWKGGRDHSNTQRLDFLVRHFGPDTALVDITTTRLDKLVAHLARLPSHSPGQKLSGGSINRYLSTASALLTFCASRGFIPAVPQLPWQQEGQHRLLWLSEEDEGAICAALEARGLHTDVVLVRVLASTGLRLGELYSLEPGQIEDDWLRLWKTKTNRPRSVPIAQPLARELRGIVGAGLLPKRTTLRHHFDMAVKSAGRNEGFVLHSLRHTTATRLVQQGVNLAVVQRFMGHANVKTTMIYAHVSDDLLVEAANKVSQRAGQTLDKAPFRVHQFPEKTTA